MIKEATHKGDFMDDNTSGQGKTAELPDGIQGWSWGAFFLNWIWGLGNRTYLSLFCLIPYVGLIMAIVLGFKGREWAWRNKEWDDIDHFNRVQRLWSVWGVGLIVGAAALGFVAAILVPIVAPHAAAVTPPTP